MLTINVDLKSEVPVYRQIVEEFRRLFALGVFSEGMELPSVRDLGARIGVNLNTVAKAYRILAVEGLVDLWHGSRVRARKPVSLVAEPIVDQEAQRRLHEVVSRLILRGAKRSLLERVFGEVLNSYFEDSMPSSS